GIGVVVEELDRLERGGADDRIATAADRRGDAQNGLHHLIGSLVGERAAFADDPDFPLLENEAGHDADLAFLGGDHTGAVGSDQRAIAAVEVFAGDHHVPDRNAFGDAHDHLDAGLGGFHDRIGGERWWNEDDADIGSGDLHRFAHRFEHRAIEVLLATFAGSYAAHHIGAV